MVVIVYVSFGYSTSLLPNILGSIARFREASFLIVVCKVKVLAEWLFEAISNLAVIIVARCTTFKVALNCIFRYFTVLVNSTFCINTFSHLLHCLLLTIQFVREDPVN